MIAIPQIKAPVSSFFSPSGPSSFPAIVTLQGLLYFSTLISAAANFSSVGVVPSFFKLKVATEIDPKTDQAPRKNTLRLVIVKRQNAAGRRYRGKDSRILIGV